MKDIIFFNFFNNGDIHLSRGFIKYIIQKIHEKDKSVNFFYAHKNKKLLNDLNIIEDNKLLSNIKNHFDEFIDRPDGLYINTWYASGNYKYMNMHGISFDTLYELFNNICKTHFEINLDLEDPRIFFPNINYNKFFIKNASDFLKNCSRPVILIANGPALSGQAVNFNLTETIIPLAKKYHGITFILTNIESHLELLPNNIYYSHQIINKKTIPDLNECSYLSIYSNLIIGRSSGVYSFSLVKENLFERNINMLSFSNINFEKYWLSNKFKDKINYSSTIINSFKENTKDAQEIIDDQIKKILDK